MSLPLWRDKKLKILGLVSAQRLSLAPEIPTIAETFPGYDLGIWQSIVAPAGTPREIVARLFASINKVLHMPEVRDEAARRRDRARRQQVAGGLRRLHPRAGGRARQGHQGRRAETGLAQARGRVPAVLTSP